MKKIITILSFLLFVTPAMAQTKVSALPDLTTPAPLDETYVVDKSDTTDGADGSSKKVQLQNLSLSPVTYTVCPSSSKNQCNYTTDGTADDVQIQAAITALGSQGGTVAVLAGDYTFSRAIEMTSKSALHVMKGAKITGASGYAPDNCIVVNSRNVCSLIRNDDESAGNTAINIQVDGELTLEGITVTYTNSWAGVHFHKATYSRVGGSGYIHHIAYGVGSEGGGNDSRYFSVFLTESDYNTIEGIRAAYTGDDNIGIRRESDYNIVQNVVASNAKYGHCFQVAGGSTWFGGTSGGIGNKIINNTCLGTDNQTRADNCVAIHSAHKTIVQGNQCLGTGGGILHLGTSLGTIISNNYIQDPATYGIAVWTFATAENVSSVTISNNVINLVDANTAGVFVETLMGGGTISHVTISNNTVYGAGYATASGQRGIYVYANDANISDVKIDGNYFYNLSNAAVYLLTDATAATISNLSINGIHATETGYAVMVDTQTGGSISDIYIADTHIKSSVLIDNGATSARGIRLNACSNCEVTGGNINVSGIAVSETGSSNNNRFTNIDTTGSGTTAPQLVGANSYAFSVGNDRSLALDVGSGFGQMTVDGSSGSCMMLRDTDDAGWSECKVLDGTMTCAIDADGVCD